MNQDEISEKESQYGNPECAGCIYHCVLSGYNACDYIFIVGTRRPCPPGKLCTVKKAAERTRREMKAPSKGRRLDPKVDEQRMELYNQGMSDCEIAVRQGVSQAAIAKWRNNHKLQRNIQEKTKKWCKESFAERMELYNKGLSDGQIAKELGLNTSTIMQWRHRRGLPALYEPASGQKKEGIL